MAGTTKAKRDAKQKYFEIEKGKIGIQTGFMTMEKNLQSVLESVAYFLEATLSESLLINCVTCAPKIQQNLQRLSVSIRFARRLTHKN